MDRFEAVEAMGNSSVEANLHSSMDRFEVLTVMIVNLQGFIYIPVWIDLKFNVYKMCNYRIDIYIPVWIDLKKR